MGVMSVSTRKRTEGRAAVSRFVWRYLSADWRRACGFGSGMLFYVLMTVASTWLIGLAVEAAGHGAGLGTLVLDLLGILLALASSIVARWFADRTINLHTASAMAAIVKTGFEKVQAFETSWHADNFAGSTARKVTRAAQGYDMFVSCWYFFFLPSGLLVLVTSVTIAVE